MAKLSTQLLFLLLLLSLKSLAQLPRNGFEGTAADTWNFTAEPASYNAPAEDDIWDDTTAVSVMSPFAGDQFRFMRDLDNPNGGGSFFHTLTFETMDMNGMNAGLVSFAWNSFEYEASDSIGYILYFDNGTEWDMADYVDLARNTGSWQLVQVPVPPGTQYVRLRLMAKQNGNGDYAGFDEVQIEAGLPPAVIGFEKKNSRVMEDAGMAPIQLNIANPGFFPSSVKVSVVAASSAVNGADYVFADSVYTFEASAGGPIQVQIPLPDDAVEDGGKYLILQLSDFDNADAGANLEHILLIADNDIRVPEAQSEPFVSLRHVGSFPGNPNGGSAEISAYDPGSKRLFTTNITKNTLDILDLKDPVAATYISSVDMSPYGGGINSVAVKNGIVATAVQGDSAQENGSAVFFDAMGNFISSVTVGNLPDMVIFTNDGKRVLTANEGEPNSDYSFDPLGSVSVIDLTSGVSNITDNDVTTLTFENFDGQMAELIAAGVRIFGPNATVGSDLEPEYICVSPDDQTALVSLQENNAVAIIDLVNLQVTAIQPLGYKDLSLPGNAFDASDQAPGIFFANWNIKGMYQPDAIECFEVGGVTYAITANEGDAREYDTFAEVTRLSAANLDPTAFPDAAYLKKSELAGRLNITKATGDTDGDGDLDEIYTLGGRSFSIWNTATGELVWDSGNDLETITANDPVWGQYFNASNGSTPSFKNRSDDKGPEPEAVTIAEIEGRIFAFIGLERIGGIAAYEVTDPANPEFVQYINTRIPPSQGGQGGGGDLGPEGLIFIPKNESPNGRNLLVLSNEISGTISVFQIELDRTKGGGFTLETYDYNPTTSIVDFQGEMIADGGISGLHYIPGTDLEFYAVSDRGPNADASLHPNAAGATLLFPAPDYAPLITRFRAENGEWTVLDIQPILRPDGTPITGLPLPQGAGATGETAWADTTPVVLTPDVWGMDSEGIVEDNFGNLWLCDEYGASVWKINKATKQVIKRYTPFPTQAEDAALPTVIGKRRANRGFEGVAITPNGKVYAFLQSVADNPNTAAGNSGRLLRLVEIDPETDAVRQFAYEIQPVTGQIRTRDWKVGDLVAVNNEEFLLVEHAERNGWNVKNIYKINIVNATPLTTEDYGGQTMEQVGTAAGIAAFGVNVVEKTLVLDLLEAGWDRSHDKPEGLTIINDTTIAVVNDNDFAINSPAGDGSIIFTGKTTRLYIYGLPQPLGYVSPYCSYDFPQANAAACEGETITLDAGAGFNAYQWSDGSTGQTLAVDTEGMYSVTVTNGVGCKAIDSVQVNLLLPANSTIAQTLCLGGSITVNGTIFNEANPVGTVILEGANVNGCDSIIQVQLSFYPAAAGSISVSICEGETYQVGSNTYSTSGTFTALLPNASFNGCDSTVTLQLEVKPSPAINLGADMAICQDQFITFNAGAGFDSYFWNTGAVTQTIQVSAAGNYSVTVTAANGCTGSDALMLTVNPVPSVEIGANQTICEGETATLNAGAGFNTYAWSTGAATPSIQVAQTGTYSVVVSNSSGCTDTDVATVFVNPAPDVNLGPDTTVFEPDTYLLDAGAGFGYTYLWSDGSANQTLTVTIDGTYSVTVTDANGCSTTGQVIVNFEPNAVKEPGLSGKLQLFPNPTSGWLNLAFNGFEAGTYDISLYDLTGRLILLKKTEIHTAEQTAQLDLHALAKGTYMVRIASEKGLLTGRVVVQ